MSLANPNAEKIYVGKRGAKHAVEQPDINQILAEKAKAGKSVLRLKGGDPYLFGRGAEEAEVLRQAADEEWLLFPAHDAPPGFARLSRGHVRLRANIDVLVRLAQARGSCARRPGAARSDAAR